MKPQKPEKMYRIRELVDLRGYPKSGLLELGRSLNRHENPNAKKNSPYKITLEEAKRHFGY